MSKTYTCLDCDHRFSRDDADLDVLIDTEGSECFSLVVGRPKQLAIEVSVTVCVNVNCPWCGEEVDTFEGELGGAQVWLD